MRTTVLAIAFAATLCGALVTSYKVDPTSAEFSGWTRTLVGQDTVGQVIVANFDSLRYVELFAGEYGQGGNYNLVVKTSGGTEITQSVEGSYRQPQDWVLFDIGEEDVLYPESIVKGRALVFQFTRGGSDSIQFYTDPTGPYEYGDIILPGGSYQPPPTGTDLCMRVLAALDPVDSSYWGFNMTPINWVTPDSWGIIKQSAASAGMRMVRAELPWSWVQPDSGVWEFDALDQSVAFAAESLGCEVLGLLAYGTKWASTCSSIQVVEDRAETTWYEHCPPRGLFASVESASNYWARYVESIVARYGGSIRTYEIWNEPQLLHVFWRWPNTGHYVVNDTSGMCSLYVRLCVVADSVIKYGASGDTTRRVLVLSNSADLEPRMKWTQDFFRIATESGTKPPFWDGVAIHPYDTLHYHRNGGLQPPLFEAAAESMRSVMRDYNDDGELWITEWGSPTYTSPEYGQQANELAEAFVLAKASEASVPGRYDRMCWYSFLDGAGTDPHGGFGLLDTMYQPKASMYASGQAYSALVGKRFNGRVLSGGAGLDTQAYACEFEDPADGRRTWVAWQSDGREAEVALPCRVDSLTTTELAYGPSTDVRAATAGADGWFRTRVGARPVFAREPATARISRPDLVVDSIRVTTAAPRAGERLDAVAFLRNVGTRTTPAGLPVVVTLSLDGTEVGRAAVRSRITAAASVTVSVRLPAGAAGSRLLSAIANPDARFVELDADNNAAHAPVTILPRTR